MKRAVYLLVLLSLWSLPVSAEDFELHSELDAATKAWLGTAWGLGLPQSEVAQVGKINCGMFVGVLLKEIGFKINHKKLQRQPAELIIKSLTTKSHILRFRNRKMSEFVEAVEKRGDGWYVLGLDNHVGFVRVDGGEAWFVHADYVTQTVVKERLIKSPSVISSKYRVIGKILQKKMMDRKSKGESIPVIGKW